MKNFFKIFSSVIVGALIFPVFVGATTLFPSGGGSGWGTPGGIQSGSIMIGNGLSPFATSSDLTFSTSLKKLTATYASSTAISAGTICLTADLPCRTTWPTGGGSAFPFTVNTNYNSTTSVIGFLSGLFSLSSTTLNGTKLADVAQGFTYTGTNGLIQSISTSTLASQVFTATTFPINSIITSNASGNLAATGTQLTVGNILATTTAASTFAGAVRTSSYLNVGSISAPLNTTAGDAKVTRLVVGTDVAFDSTRIIDSRFTSTATANGATIPFNFLNVITPASNSLSDFRAINFQNTWNGAADITMDNVEAGHFEGLRFGTTANGLVTSSIGVNAWGVVSSGGAASSSVNSVIGLQAIGSTLTSAGSILNATSTTGITVTAVSGSSYATSTTVKGIVVNDNGASNNLTNTWGIDIASMTRGTTANYGLRVAAPSGGTSNYAINLSDTGGTAAGGITWGTDTNLYRSAANLLKTDSRISFPYSSSTVFSTYVNSSTTLASFSYASSTNFAGGGLATCTGTSFLQYTATGFFSCGTPAGGGTVTAVTGTWPIISSGGATPNITFGGLSTSSAAVTGNIPYFSGVNTFANVATGTVTCTGTASCGAGSYVLGANLTITGAGSATGLGTTTPWTTGQVAYVNSNSAVTSVATSSITSNSSITVTNGTTAYVIGSQPSFAINLGNANSWTALQTFANSSTTLGSFSYSSSTVDNIGTLNLPNLSQGSLYVGSGNVARTVATSTLTGTGVISVTAGAYILGATPIVVSCSTCGTGTVTAVTGTWPVISSGGATPNLTFGGLSTTTALVAGQAVYASGVNTLASIATSTPTYAGSLSYSGTAGSFIGGSSGSLSLNMANANSWTALQTFTNSSTTLGSFAYASSTLYNGGGLQTCDPTTGKLTWTAGVFACGTDQSGGSSFSGAGNSIIVSNTAGNALIATGTQLTVGNILATTTATNLFMGNVNVNGGRQYQYNGTKMIIATPAIQSWFFGNSGNLTETGDYNVGIGDSSMGALTGGARNMGIGGASFEFLQGGSDNVGIGFNAQQLNTNASQNVGIGTKALLTNDISAGNIGIGYQAGYSLTGAANIIIGQNVEAPTAASNAQLNIGNLIYGTGLYNNTATRSATPTNGKVGISTSTPWAAFSINPTALGSGVPEFAIGSTSATHMIVTGAGNVGIGTTNPAQKLQVNGSAYLSSGNIFLDNGFAFQWGVGTTYVNGNTGDNSVRFITNSVERLSVVGANVGVSTSTPWAGFSVNPNALGSNVPMFAIGSSTMTNFLVDDAGRISTKTIVAPTVASCGTTPTIQTGSNDNAGYVDIGSGASTVACTVTFSKSWGTNAPVCTANMATSSTAVTISASTTPTTLVLGFSVSRSSNRFSYMCQGRN